MGKENVDYSQPFPWCSGSHNRPHQSQWLQTTLSDLENKTKKMVNIIEDDGDRFAERAEMFYERRHELLEIVRDLHQSYCALAEKYEQLRSEYLQVSQMKSSCFPLNNNNNNKNPKQFDELLHECQSSPDTLDPCFDIDALNKTKADITVAGDISSGGLQKIISAVDLKGNDVGDGELQLNVAERERKWNEWRLKIAKLIDENMGQQAELIKRNDEKREIIKQLRSQVNILMNENRALKRFLPTHYNNCEEKEEEEEEEDMKAVKSNVSKLKGRLNCMGKFLD